MCTGIRFLDDKGQLYFGRNLDWNQGYGQRVVVTPHGFKRTYAYGVEPKANYAVIGPCIVEEGVPLYFDCGNDAGLGIAGLNFPGYAQYEKDAIPGKINIAAYEFPLWVASNFKSVDEVEEALADVAIVAKQINAKYPVSLLHWIIADAKRSIVVEYMPDGMHVHHDDIDVLTNQPTFDWHMEHLRSYMNVSPHYAGTVKWGNFEMEPYGGAGFMVGLPGSYYSPDRFVRASYINSHYPVQTGEQDNVSRLFHTLGGVAMALGGSILEDGSYEITLYTGGISMATKTYYMNTYDDPDIKAFPMSDADIEGSELYTFPA